MSDAEILYQIAVMNLSIPVWQVAIYVGVTTISMLLGRIKLCLITTYLFTLYWGFFLYWGEVMSSLSSFPYMGTLYIVCGMLHIALTVVAFLKGE